MTPQSLVSDHPLLRGLDKDQEATLLSYGEERVFEPGALIFRKGDAADALYLILSGEVALELCRPPRAPACEEILGSGDILGLSWLSSPYVWQLDARARQRTVLYAIPAGILRAEMDDMADQIGTAVARLMLGALYDRLKRARARRLQIPARMRLQDIMTSSVQTARPEESAELAWQRMKRGGIHHLVVMDGRRVAGVVSARDLGGATGEDRRRGRSVGELMTPDVVTAPPDTTFRKAANLMRGRTLGCLPVLDGDRLVGIVTVSDLLEQVGRGSARPIEESVRWTLRDRGPRRRRS